MSNLSSPTRFSSAEDIFYDNANVSDKMRVSNRIKVPGDHDNAVTAPKPNPWDEEKFDMKVPDRILVVGQDQYYGTTAPPREVLLENSVMPTDPGMIRVQTPPRVITLNEHYFPTIDDEPDEEDQDTSSAFSPIRKDKNAVEKFSHKTKSSVLINHWPTGPNVSGDGDYIRKGLTPSEELSHLRTQMAKLNRRVLALEFDINQRQQRDKMGLVIAMGYIFFKLLVWLNK